MIIAVMRKGEQMRLIDVSELKEWIKNWFTKNRLYHPYAKNNNIPITELYDILEQLPSAQQWIPVTKRLPENDDECLTILEDGLYYVQAYSDGEWYYDDVVAWMPIPEPYKEHPNAD
jgi:hypothetical protein